jgi:KaiC/GvpD/RAD55 family RecA-like ATPase
LQLKYCPLLLAKPTNPKISKIALAGSDNECSFYTVDGNEGKFLQQVERKPFESVVITLDGMQGAGKTTTLYKFMNAFASPGNKCLFISGEEHPASSLAKDKVQKYLTPKAQQNIDSVGEVADLKELYEFIEPYEIIFIDSWQKLQRMVGNIRLDEDLRKKFNGKVFVVIFQQTTTGRTKGGAEVVFDGDIIIKMVKENSFADNYAYFDKNRYTKIPIENIRYNIASGKIYNPNQAELEQKLTNPTENTNFSFKIY